MLNTQAQNIYVVNKYVVNTRCMHTAHAYMLIALRCMHTVLRAKYAPDEHFWHGPDEQSWGAGSTTWDHHRIIGD